MMVVLDTTMLVLLIDPSARPPLDETSGNPVDKCKERIDFLVKTLEGSQVLLPTPVLAEVLVRAGASKQQFLNEITNTYAFRVASFDERAAVELSMMLDHDLSSSRKRSDIETKAKLNFDRQIVAIAKVNGIKVIYSDDRGLRTTAERNGIDVVRTADLPLPPPERQQDFF